MTAKCLKRSRNPVQLYRGTALPGFTIKVAKIAAASALLLGVFGCNQRIISSNQADTTADGSTYIGSNPVARPTDESDFISIAENAVAEMNAAPNDIIRNQAFERGKTIYCSAIKRINTFNNWTGRVLSIESAGHFVVDISGQGLNQDFEEDIDPSSNMFIVISKLREGQAVRISGHLDQASIEIECDNVWAGGFTDVIFTSITPL